MAKPLALTDLPLNAIDAGFQNRNTNKSPLIMVGFSRCFASFTCEMKILPDAVKKSKSFIIRTMNASAIENGSCGTNWANGGKASPKERAEVFTGRAVLKVDSLRKLEAFSWSSFKRIRLLRRGKAQVACFKAFGGSLKTGSPTRISDEELMEVSRVTIDAQKQLDYSDPSN